MIFESKQAFGQWCNLHLDAGNHRMACPQCERGASDKAVSVTVCLNGATKWHCFRCGFAGAISEGHDQGTQRPAKATTAPQTHEVLSNQKRALWNDSKPVRGTIAETYLRTRKCVTPSKDADLRFHPKIYHWPSKSYLAAMVALITDFRDALVARSLHFTFLHHDGTRKADVIPPRLLLPGHQKKGGVIRLWPDCDISHGLALAEGVETALSVAHVFTPVWATIDAGNMAMLPVVDGIPALTVYADHDPAGLSAAQQLATRWRNAGREVCIQAPAAPGHDVNDLVQAI